MTVKMARKLQTCWNLLYNQFITKQSPCSHFCMYNKHKTCLLQSCLYSKQWSKTYMCGTHNDFPHSLKWHLYNLIMTPNPTFDFCFILSQLRISCLEHFYCLIFTHCGYLFLQEQSTGSATCNVLTLIKHISSLTDHSKSF